MQCARSYLLWLLLAALFLLGHPSYAATFTGLGVLAGGLETQARGVSGDGLTVVGLNLKFGSLSTPFVWTSAHGMVKIETDTLGGTDGYALGVNADGSVVVGHDDIVLGGQVPLGQHCIRWESYGVGVPGGSALYFPSELPGDLGVFLPECSALGVSDDGLTVVGWARGPSGLEAFRKTYVAGIGTTMVGLGDLAGGIFRSIAYDASADGSTIVGYSNTAIADEAFVWTSGGGMVSIGVGNAFSITPDASTVVGFTDASTVGVTGVEAFRWTSDTGMVGLGTLPGGTLESLATDVSADGSVVVGNTISSHGAGEAFIWDATNGMRSLKTVLTGLGADLTGWTLRNAQGISDDGNVIVGYGTNPSGSTEAWMANLILVPEPSAALLQGIALIVLAGLAARQKS